MRLLQSLVARVRALLRRDAVADEIREELDFHLRSRIDQYQREGLTPDEARRQARRRVGNVAVHRDRGYDIRGGGVIETMVQDVRYAMRLLRRQPGFSLLAIATLSLGIGASTAIFSVIDAAILRPLPYPHPEQLVAVRVEEYLPAFERRSRRTPSLDDRRIWQEASRTLAVIAAMDRDGIPRVMDGDPPERLDDRRVSAGFFELHGVAPVVGRAFNAEDTRPSAPPVAVISYGYWQRRFGGRPNVIGELVRYDNQPTTIIGVVPSHFFAGTQIWRPLQVPAERTGARSITDYVYARLRPGVTPEEAAAELTAMTAARSDPPDADTKPVVLVTRLLDETPEQTRITTAVLGSAVLLILLIGCVNVAGLLLARGATRRAEFAVRASIGAGRRRLVRQLLTESLVLAAAGGLAGVLVAGLSLDALVANIPIRLPDNTSPTISWTVLAAAAVLSLLTGLLFGLVPAIRLTRAGDSEMLRATGRGRAALPRRSGQWLVAAEVTLATVLLAGSGLMIRSFEHVLHVDVGFDPSTVMTLETMPIGEDVAVQASYYPQLVRAVRALPGVGAVGAIDHMPLMGTSAAWWVNVPGGEGSGIAFRHILPDYLEAIGLPLRRGRDLLDSDRTGDVVRAVLLNEAAARELFPAGPALGRQVLLGRARAPADVVGIVGNVLHLGPVRPLYPEIYLPFVPADYDFGRAQGLTVVIRPDGRAPVTAATLTDVARAIGPPVVVERIRTGTDWYGETIATPRQRTVLLTLLGGLGLVLALVGIFGMTAYAVARRTREIGVRIAFGARPADVVRRMIADAAWPIALGTLAGLGAAWLTTGVIASFLFETEPTDPATFAAVAVGLAAAGLVAAWIPARRAARVDPVAALRAE
jgi:predicted permease